jgi:hypothetical protein
MLHKAGAGHYPRQQLPIAVPSGGLAIGIALSGSPIKLRFRDGPDRIDGTSHRAGEPSAIGQGEIHSGAGAVGRRGGWVVAGRGPKPTHLGFDPIPLNRRLVRVYVLLAAFLQ